MRPRSPNPRANTPGTASRPCASAPSKRRAGTATATACIWSSIRPGAKRWIWRGKIRAKGKRCDLGLGSIQIVSLADARDQAAQFRREARAGKDPLGDRQRERHRERHPVPTFKTAAKAVHKEQAKTFRNGKHKAQWLASLEQYAFPLIGDQRVDALETADVLKVLAPIWTTTPETARRVKQRIKVVFDWTKASGFRSGDNPTDGLKTVLPKHRGEKQHHAALPYPAVRRSSRCSARPTRAHPCGWRSSC